MKQPPIAILITFGRDMIKEHGGIHKFLREFFECMSAEDNWWNHKCSNLPVYDVAYAYIVIENVIRYRVNVAGYETGPFTYWDYQDIGPSVEVREVKADWNRIILSGPITKAPEKIKRQGFQGFRYVYEEIF